MIRTASKQIPVTVQIDQEKSLKAKRNISKGLKINISQKIISSRNTPLMSPIKPKPAPLTERQISEKRIKPDVRISTNSGYSFFNSVVDTSKTSSRRVLTEFSLRHIDKLNHEIVQFGIEDARKFEVEDNNPIKKKEEGEDESRLGSWRTYEKALILSDGGKQVIKVSSKTMLNVRVATTGKLLPAMFQITKAEPDTEIYVSFNRNPSSIQYDIKAEGHRVFIPQQYQKEIDNRSYGIRILVLFHHTTVSQTFFSFAPTKTKPVVIPEIERIDLNDYKEYLNISLHKKTRSKLPSGIAQSSRNNHYRSVSTISFGNHNSLEFMNKQLSDNIRKENCQKLSFKIKEVQKKKEELLKEKNTHLKNGIDKFLKQKQKNEVIFTVIIDKANKIGVQNAWAHFYRFYRVMDMVRQRFLKTKLVLFIQNKKVNRIKLFQRKWKEFMKKKCESDPLHNKKGGALAIGISKMAIGLYLKQAKGKVIDNACNVIGCFGKNIFNAFSLNNKIFDYTATYTILKNKFRKHMRLKKELFTKFCTEFRQISKDLIITEGIFCRNYLSIYLGLISETDLREMFDYIFNYNLLSFINTKIRKIKKCSNQQADRLICTPMHKLSIQRPDELSYMPTLKAKIEGHKHRKMFLQIEENIKDKKYEASTQYSVESRISSRSSLIQKFSFKENSQNKSNMREKEEMEEDKERILKLIDKKNLKQVFEIFLSSGNHSKFSITYSKNFFVSLIYTSLEMIYFKDGVPQMIPPKEEQSY